MGNQIAAAERRDVQIGLGESLHHVPGAQSPAGARMVFEDSPGGVDSLRAVVTWPAPQPLLTGICGLFECFGLQVARQRSLNGVARIAGGVLDIGCRAALAMGGNRFDVSSYHNQALDRLGEGLRVVGRADDGCIEVVEHTHVPVLAVQWHPEDDADIAPHQQGLFDSVVAAACRRQYANGDGASAFVEVGRNG